MGSAAALGSAGNSPDGIIRPALGPKSSFVGYGHEVKRRLILRVSPCAEELRVAIRESRPQNDMGWCHGG